MLNDWIRGPYRYLTSKTIAKSQISGSTTVALSGSLTLTASPIGGSAALSFSSSAVITFDQETTKGVAQPLRRFRSPYGYIYLSDPPAYSFGAGVLEGVGSFSFDTTGQLLAGGELAGSDGVAFTSTSVLDGVTSLSASESLTFSSTASIVTTTGDLSGSALLQLNPVAILRGTGKLEGSGSLTFNTNSVLGGSRGIGVRIGPGFQVYSHRPAATYLSASYYAARFVLSASTEFSFSSTSDLTEANEGAIVGLGSLSFSATSNLKATGRLSGIADVAFSSTAVPTNASASPLTANGTITFSDSNTINGVGGLVAAESITFDSVARLTSGAISGSGSITFSSTATAIQKARATANGSITFTSTADGRILAGESISGSASFGFTSNAEFVFGGGTIIRFITSGSTDPVLDYQVIGSESNVVQLREGQRVGSRKGKVRVGSHRKIRA